eukprot:750455-Hanusia_phi.AAC.1
MEEETFEDAVSYANHVAHLLSEDDDDDGEMEEMEYEGSGAAGAGAGAGDGGGGGAGGGGGRLQPRYEAVISRVGLSHRHKKGGYAFAKEENATETYLNLSLYLLPLKNAAPRSCRMGGVTDVLRWLIGKKVSFAKRINSTGLLLLLLLLLSRSPPILSSSPLLVSVLCSSSSHLLLPQPPPPLTSLQDSPR